MSDQNLVHEVSLRRTFAIISHPDAGKTTITEKLLLLGKQIQTAGNVKAKKSDKFAKSDWMAMEKERGISITTSIMQFPYQDHLINLLDTPGHEDFSEDTYRTLSAVDSCLMVIDGAKGVEARTLKLIEVTRLRHTPIITFVNKFDRECLEPMALMDNIESHLGMTCFPLNWPIGSGQSFSGLYRFTDDTVILYESGKGSIQHTYQTISGIDNPILNDLIDAYDLDKLKEDVALLREVFDDFDVDAFQKGLVSPIFFGSALANFGIDFILNAFVRYAPKPLKRITDKGTIEPDDPNFSGFVFKIQANMDPRHRDRIAFIRICSGIYQKNMKLFHVREKKTILSTNALTFLAGDRSHTDIAYPGDIIGLHNHGRIKIGDTFTQGDQYQFLGIPNFAPEIFKRVLLKDPLKQKQLLKGLIQLSEEGTVQVFRPLTQNTLIVGAVGVLQFDVVASRLKTEYHVDAIYEGIPIQTARWVESDSEKDLKLFKDKCANELALDSADHLTYLASSKVKLNLTIERYPNLKFYETREH